MGQKLRKMKYTSVDLVRRGANPDADIKILKSIQEGGENNLKGFEKIAMMIAKALNINTDSLLGIEKALDDAVHNEVFFSTYAFNESINSVLEDNSLTVVQKMEALKDNLKDFSEDITKSFESWTDGQALDITKSLEISDVKLEALEKSRDRLDEIIKAAKGENVEGGDGEKLKRFLGDDEDPDEDDDFEPEDTEDDPEDSEDKNIKLKKGEDTMPTIDVEKMSPEDRATLEAIAKKYEAAETDPGKPEEVQKSEEMHPEVKKALDEVAELKKSMEMEKLENIAKKYEAIGKKADELAPKLYELKKAGESHYNDYVAILDEMVTASANSEIFKEFGSGGKAGATDLDGVVAELRKSMPEATQAELVVKAFELNPNLDPYTGKMK